MTDPGPVPRDAAGRIDRGGLVAAALLSGVLGAIGWVRHVNYWSGAFDLGIFDQAVWQLSEGRAFVSLVDRNVFADHVSPVLLLFVPLYWVAASPLWLIGGQALALGLTVLPMRALARDAHVSPHMATALVCVSAPVFSAAIFDFHPSTLAVPWIAVMLLYARRDHRAWALCAAVAVVLCRADLSLIIVAVALLAGPRTRVPLALTGIAGAAIGVAVPSLFGEANGWTLHFGHLGSGPVDALFHPWRLAVALLSDGSLRPLATSVLAAGCLVVLRPRWLLALIVAGSPVLLSRWGATAQPWFHYGAPMAPIAIGGTIAALDPRRPPWRLLDWFRPGIVVVAVLVALGLASPLAASTPDQFRLWDIVKPPPGRDSRAALSFVRDDDVVSADNQLVPHLSDRKQIFMFPLPFAVPKGFLQGSEVPDLRGYPRGLVDVVVAPEGSTVKGYEVVGRVEGFVILRRIE